MTTRRSSLKVIVSQTHRRGRKVEETQDSVLLATVEGHEIRLTPSNTVFVTFNGLIEWPTLKGKMVRWEDKYFRAPMAVVTKLVAILSKQAQIRKDHAEDFDDKANEDAWTYWNETGGHRYQ